MSPWQKSNVLLYPLMPHHILQWILAFYIEMHAVPNEESNYWGRWRGNMDSREIKLRGKWACITHSHTSRACVAGGHVHHAANKPSREQAGIFLVLIDSPTAPGSYETLAKGSIQGNDTPRLQIKQEQVFALTRQWELAHALLGKENKQPGHPG